MACMAQAINVKQAVLDAVNARAYPPLELLEFLSARGLSDSEIKQAIVQLSREGLIVLTSEGTLAPAEDNAA